ncbi:amino acid adenylation domain-containing protein [Streptomyces sp. RK9]|uniref:amino acid adenylation domain-containing protein n=1 Tax=Streptomyces sp. RK9 TaxID=3239284 RepID=UPI00386708FB
MAHPSMLSGAVRRVEADSVVRMVRDHARLRPDAVAVESAGQLVTFRQLWCGVLSVAAGLEEAGVGPGDRVALWADRSAGVVTGALAVMALGAAYVPIDPAHPGDRTAAVLAGADPAALLHDGGPSAAGLPQVRVPVLDVRELLAAGARGAAGVTGAAGAGASVGGPGAVAPPERALPGPEDIAYVVFTSGSTGTPKGVMVPHASLANYVSWCGELVGGGGVGSPLFASLGFDLAMTSLWVPLARGLRVVTVSGLHDQETLFGAREDPYTFVKLTPSHARFFDVLAEPPRYDRATRLLMFGGEGLDPALIASLGDRVDGVRLVNHYGPTETTIGCCAYAFDSAHVPTTPTVPIGAPAWNTRAYVVDDQLRPVAPGRPGELVIAGRAVAAGYLGGRDTGGKFLDERELGGAAGRAYRTGDMVELLPEGALLYLGRGDDQLKVNGHRVELGELRHHVLAVPGVADAAFDIVRGPVDALELFIRVKDASVLASSAPAPASASASAAAPTSAADRSHAPDFTDTVRDALAEKLPSALVPESVRVVPDIVFNANGKCDVAATRRQLDRGI